VTKVVCAGEGETTCHTPDKGKETSGINRPDLICCQSVRLGDLSGRLTMLLCFTLRQSGIIGRAA
jgi:hypothetical protein